MTNTSQKQIKQVAFVVYNWYATDKGETYKWYEVGMHSAEGKVIAIWEKTKKNSLYYLIKFDNGDEVTISNWNKVYYRKTELNTDINEITGRNKNED